MAISCPSALGFVCSYRKGTTRWVGHLIESNSPGTQNFCLHRGANQKTATLKGVLLKKFYYSLLFCCCVTALKNVVCCCCCWTFSPSCGATWHYIPGPILTSADISPIQYTGLFDTAAIFQF